MGVCLLGESTYVGSILRPNVVQGGGGLPRTSLCCGISSLGANDKVRVGSEDLRESTKDYGGVVGAQKSGLSHLAIWL